jgi:O-antigen ligase/tetratricopeptide (TPR) repeat protein
MLALFEVLSGLFLVWYLILPIQNYEFLFQLAAGAILLWLFAAMFFKRWLFGTTIFFQFCLIISFTMRALAAGGWMANWYEFLLWSEWIVLLFFYRNEKPFAASLFTAIVLISPFYWPILNVRNEPFVGLNLWTLAVVHLFLLARTKNKGTLHPIFWLMLLVSILPIPFALYSWRALQFMSIQVCCVLLYYSITQITQDKLRSLLMSYLVLSSSMIVYVLVNDCFTIRHIGFNVLALRHHILEHANTLAPFYVIVTSILVYIFSKVTVKYLRLLLGSICVGIGVLQFLTYSRNGWVAYGLFWISYALFQLFRNRAKMVNWKVGLTALVVIAVVFSFIPGLRQTSRERILDQSSAHYRVFAWKLGWKTFKDHPLFGTGWFNYYSHAKLLPDLPLKNLEMNVGLGDVHDHSLFLDLTEAGGIPLVLVFAVLVVLHFKGAARNSALLAGLLAVTFNNLLDTASLWLTVYPHLWVLLALCNPVWLHTVQPKRKIHLGLSILALVLIAGGAVFPLVEDRLMQTAVFQHYSNRNSEALESLHTASMFAPLHAMPLEWMAKIQLSLKNPAESLRQIKKCTNLKKEYSPYYSWLAEIALAENDLKNAADQLRRAQRLDPYTVAGEKTYLLSALLEAKPQFYKNHGSFYRYLATRRNPNELKARELLDSLNAEQFLTGAFDYINQNASTPADRALSLWNLYENLMALNKTELAANVLENVLQRRLDVGAEGMDNICYLLALHYSQRKLLDQIRSLIPYTSTWAINPVRAHYELAKGNLVGAETYLDAALKSNPYHAIAPSWEAYWKAAADEEGLRTHFRIMQRLPIYDFNPRYSEEIGRSFFRQGDYQKAADEFDRLSFYDYSNPMPHWWRARIGWLFNKDGSKANQRLRRFVPSNRFFENLYRAAIQTQPNQDVSVQRFGLPNQFGGIEWRIGIFAHPTTKIIFPSNIQFSSLNGEAAMLDQVWDKPTDGAALEFLDKRSMNIFSLKITPVQDPTQRQWIPFRWSGSQQSITVRTVPLSNPSYDWFAFTINEAK